MGQDNGTSKTRSVNNIGKRQKPLSNNELFAFDESDDDSSNSDMSDFLALDDCIDSSLQAESFSLANLIHGRNKPVKRQKTVDLKPIAFVRFNTRLGKPKPVTIRALLDSGGSESLVTNEFAKKLRVKTSQTASTVWTTPGGAMTTKSKVKAQFTLPELQDDKLIEWDLHVADALGKYDMIIGRDLLEFLKIDLLFSDQSMQWGTANMPFKDGDATVKDAYHVSEETPALAEAHERPKNIPDAKYEEADLEKVCKEQIQLDLDEQDKLYSLLRRYSSLFDGGLEPRLT